MSGPQAKQRLDSPGLVWEAGETPASAVFGDVYYSRGAGLAEKRHVFLDGNGLPEAWRGRARFTICELGFGTGLNFLATWRLWAETRDTGAVLHYLAVEGHPLTSAELGQCLAAWPELAPEREALLRVYAAPQPGFQRLHPAPGIVLTLLCGEAHAMLAALETPVNAWYLDGFSPAKNPAMWSDDLFREMARRSRSTTSFSRGSATTLATYTAAGHVRRGLTDAGFAVELVEGHGRKREMIRARYGGEAHRSPEPWFAPTPAIKTGQAAIIGGGIAGAAAAAALIRKGWAVTIIERRESLAAEASGTPSGVVMPRLTAGAAHDGRIHAGAWRYGVQSWSGQRWYAPCGVLQLATDAAEATRQITVADSGVLPETAARRLEAGAASEIAGCALPSGALYFPEGGCIDTHAFCTAAANGATTLLEREVTAIHRDGERWHLQDSYGLICAADIVVLANGGGAGAFADWLPLTPRRGQITQAAATPLSASLRCVLAYGGTITPPRDGSHYVGATFDWVKEDAAGDDVNAADDARNLASLKGALPDLAAGMESRNESWAGVRWTSPDHLPVIGPLPVRAAYERDYAALRHGQHWVDYPQATYESGLFVMAGFGSHGLTLAPLMAELLACHITGEPWPLEREHVAALHPGRFLIRSLKRSK